MMLSTGMLGAEIHQYQQGNNASERKEEELAMQRLLNDLLTDCSTEEQFQFSLICQECGREWKSPAKSFSKAGSVPVTEGKKIVYSALYQREKADARQRAMQQAEKQFSRCPICHRWVCDDCFMVCDDLDMCRRCAEKLNEQGSIVGVTAEY